MRSLAHPLCLILLTSPSPLMSIRLAASFPHPLQVVRRQSTLSARKSLADPFAHLGPPESSLLMDTPLEVSSHRLHRVVLLLPILSVRRSRVAHLCRHHPSRLAQSLLMATLQAALYLLLHLAALLQHIPSAKRSQVDLLRHPSHLARSLLTVTHPEASCLLPLQVARLLHTLVLLRLSAAPLLLNQ